MEHVLFLCLGFWTQACRPSPFQPVGSNTNEVFIFPAHPSQMCEPKLQVIAEKCKVGFQSKEAPFKRSFLTFAELFKAKGEEGGRSKALSPLSLLMREENSCFPGG